VLLDERQHMQHPRMKRVALLALLLIAMLIGVAGIRAALVRSHQLDVAPVARIAIDEQAVARLSRAGQFRTVTYPDGRRVDHDAFVEWLASAYPRVSPRKRHGST